MTKTTKLTDAQAETIRRVLAAGDDALLTMGSTSRRGREGAITKTTARRLIEAGLLEGKPAQWFPGTYRPSTQLRPEDHKVYATTAGVLALRAYDAARSEIHEDRDSTVESLKTAPGVTS
jgi:hypothetical protein